MQRLDLRESREIRNIKGQEMSDAMRLHGCDQARIVRLYSANLVSHKKATPVMIGGLAFRQQVHAKLDLPHLCLSMIHVEAKPVTARWPCHHIPELCHVLVRVEKGNARSSERGNRLRCRPVEWISPPRYAEQYVGVDQA